MPGVMNVRELARMYSSLGTEQTIGMIAECLNRGRTGQSGGLKPEDFSLREVAEAVGGLEFVRSLDPRYGTPVMESGGSVNTSAFLNITGQLVSSKVLEGYHAPEFVFSKLIPDTPTRLSGERIPGATRIKDSDAVEGIHEGHPFPTYGFGEDFIETPDTRKDGLRVAVTREAVFFDRTGLVLKRAGEVGEVLGRRKELQLIDLAIGAANNYKWNGTTYNTYLTSGAWINDHSNPLTSYDDVDKAETLLEGMTDPSTGEPIAVMATHLICCPRRWYRARSILTATEIRTTVGSTETVSANPITGAYELAKSQYMKARLKEKLSLTDAQANEYWLLGNLSKAFTFMSNWPLTVRQSAANSQADFERDIVAEFRADHRGIAAVLDPRYVVRNRA